MRDVKALINQFGTAAEGEKDMIANEGWGRITQDGNYAMEPVSRLSPRQPAMKPEWD